MLTVDAQTNCNMYGIHSFIGLKNIYTNKSQIQMHNQILTKDIIFIY